MKNTPLYNTHIALGAKMVPFAGYNMPVQYKGLNFEHEIVRNGVGVFDVSHMGEFILKGENALDLIQKITTNDASKLQDGKAQYSCMTNPQGGIIDDLLVYKIDEKTYMLVVNAANIEKDWNWVTENNTKNVSVEDISEKTSLLAIQGPKALDTLQKLTDLNLATIPYYGFQKGVLAGKSNVLISATGYTGAGGFEIYFKNEYAQEIWDSIFEAGKECNIEPIGLGARDTLRLEMGYSLYGNDLNDNTSPLEAGLGWITSLNKDFTGSSILKQQKEQGLSRNLVGFEMQERGIPRHDYEITDGNGNNIGIVTSGTQSPSLQKGIGLGYIETKYAKVGESIYIKIRDREILAKIVKPPFVAPAVK